MSVIRARDLSVAYGGVEALSSLRLEIQPGTVGLLGPNGAGKTTFLKTLLGFVEPSGGSVEVLGASVDAAPHRTRERLGYFPERAIFVPGLTAVETVALAGELGGLPRSAALARAHEVLWFVGLGEARYRPIEEFSKGMQQRSKLAMALVHDPDLLLLDEPTSGLDPVGRRQMLELVRQIAARGVSVLLSTHLLHDVEQVCDAVVLLNRGRLVLEGRLDALRAHPGWVYEIRVRETIPGAFKRALSERGIEANEDPQGSIVLALEGPETRMLFETARSSQAEIRHMRRYEKTLEERFLSAVREDSPSP
jgi:ABC-2 type transport system ATP-binding protein